MLTNQTHTGVSTIPLFACSRWTNTTRLKRREAREKLLIWRSHTIEWILFFSSELLKTFSKHNNKIDWQSDFFLLLSWSNFLFFLSTICCWGWVEIMSLWVFSPLKRRGQLFILSTHCSWWNKSICSIAKLSHTLAAWFNNSCCNFL